MLLQGALLRQPPPCGVVYTHPMCPSTTPSSTPGRFGRALGIGARLATRRILPPPPPPLTPEQQRAASTERVRKGQALGRQVGQHTRNTARGGRQFTRAVWNPFAHAGSILWLEITGFFFAMFALLFVQHMWTIRASFRSGPEHAHFLAYAVFALLFLYFAASSFLKARRISRRARRAR